MHDIFNTKMYMNKNKNIDIKFSAHEEFLE